MTVMPCSVPDEETWLLFIYSRATTILSFLSWYIADYQLYPTVHCRRLNDAICSKANTKIGRL